MREVGRRKLLGLAAAAWLIAGPGGLLLREVLTCRDHMATTQHTGGGHHAPPAGPCFCSQMAGAFDQAVSVAVPALAIAAVSTAPTVDASYPAVVSLPVSLTRAPNPRPPIPL